MQKKQTFDEALEQIAQVIRAGVMAHGENASIKQQNGEEVFESGATYIGGLELTDKYKLGRASITRLESLIPPMTDVVKLAIRITEQDFTVFETIRTIEQQRKYVARGASRTMASKHLKQADGFSHAVDLVPWIDGKPVWDWEGCFRIAHAMDAAADEYGVSDRIRWGAAWDRRLSDYGGSLAIMKQEVELYKSRHAGPDFLDGPHFEWVA